MPVTFMREPRSGRAMPSWPHDVTAATAKHVAAHVRPAPTAVGGPRARLLRVSPTIGDRVTHEARGQGPRGVAVSLLDFLIRPVTGPSSAIWRSRLSDGP